MVILNDIHITNQHPGERRMGELVLEYGFIWEGYSHDIKKLIKECPILIVHIL